MASVRGNANFKLSYVDFPPRCAGAGGIICSPNYERFDSLVTRANDWLRQNGHVKVKTCESIEVKGRYDGIVDTNKSSYFEGDHIKRKFRNMYIRALRLWVLPRDLDDYTAPQQIGYVNVVPARNDIGQFDSFGDTVRKFNLHLRQRPLPGRVLNVESQEMKFHEWGCGVDPDESCWVESVKFNLSFLVVIRIFYEVGPPAYEEIGCADFVPSCLDHGSQFEAANYESFGDVLGKASAWIRQQNSVRVTNVQSISYKLHHGTEGELDTQRSFFVESGRGTTRYIRVIRICFVKPYDGSTLTPRTPLHLNYVTFEPIMVSTGGIIGIPIFESQGETMRRAMLWLSKTDNVRVVSAETVPVRMFSGNQYGNHETTYTWNRGEQKEVWLLVIRIFLDGDYVDPPPDMLPPPPANLKAQDNCCAIL